MIMNGVMIGNHINTAAKLGKKIQITVKLHIKNSVTATALSFKNAMFSRKACYFIGEMPEWERRFPYSFL
jgi:hypothetical protein